MFTSWFKTTELNCIYKKTCFILLQPKTRSGTARVNIFVTLYFLVPSILNKHVSQAKLVSELMEEGPERRPSASDAMEKLKEVSEVAAEEDLLEDVSGCLEGMFQEGDVDIEEENTRKEIYEEEEDDLENAAKNIATARDVEEFNDAMNMIYF